MSPQVTTLLVGALMTTALGSAARSTRLWGVGVSRIPTPREPERPIPMASSVSSRQWRQLRQWRWWRWFEERREARALTTSLPVAVELMAASVRTGSELIEAMQLAALGVGGPFAADVAILQERVDDGATSAEALRQRRARRAAPGSDRLVLTCEVGRQMGAGLDLSLESLAGGLQLDALSAVNRRLASSQAIASAGVMILLPAAVIAGNAASLLSTSVGWMCVGAAALLDAIGAVWMLRLIRAAS